MNRELAIKTIAKHQIKGLSKKEREAFLMDWWVTEEDEDLQRMPKIIKDEISKSLKLEIEENETYGNAEDVKYNPIVLLGIYYEFRGVKNSYLEKEILRIAKEKVIVEGEVETLEKCPCCDYNTLDAKCEWDICKVCFWEDDCTTDLDSISGPNHMSLRQGKENFLKFGACDQQSIEYVDKDGKLKFRK